MGILQRFFKKEEQTSLNSKETAHSLDNFSFITGTTSERYNPDLLLNRKGDDVYKRMMRDSQVKSAYDLIMSILISRNFRFEKAVDDEKQKEIEEFFLFNMRNMDSTWPQALRSVLLAKAHGFSVSEKVYKTGLYNGKDKWLLKSIKAKPFETFTFDADQFGNLKKVVQEQTGSLKRMDPSKFIIYVNRPEIHPLYGESDLRAVYRPYWEKDNILKFWNIHLERVAGGFTVASAEAGAPILSTTERNDFDNVLKNITQATAIRVPSGYNIEIVQGVNTDAFEKAIQNRDKQIAKGLMIPTLLGFSEQGAVGSNAQAQTQLETFFFIVQQQGELLADAMNEQLFKELAWWNFGVEEYPRFTFSRFSESQKREIALAWAEAVQKGTVINTFEDEQRTRELLSYDQRENDGSEGEKQEIISPDDSADEVKDEKIGEKVEEIQKMAESESEDPKVMRRVDFSDIERMFADNELNFFDSMAIAVDNMANDVFDAMESMNLASPEFTIDTIDNVITSANKSATNQVIRKYLRLSYEDGRSTAQDILNKASEDAPTQNLRDRVIAATAMAKRTSVKLDKSKQESGADGSYEWSVANFVDGIALDTAERYFMAKAFWITGDLSEEMASSAKLVILNGIRDELTIDEMVTELKDILSPLIGTPGAAVVTRPRLETIVRTNLSDAFTQSQLAVYNDPDLGDFVRALKYSAILDSRTTTFCNATNGAIYPKNSPIWSSITPPNHFNCRSVIIPVTEFDNFRVSAPPTEEPSKGFGRTTL